MSGKAGWDRVRLRARELRQRQTPAEKRLWSRQRRDGLYGLKFRRQHPIGLSIEDFYSAQHWLVVELEDSFHHRQAEQDGIRTAQLEAYRYRLLRTWKRFWSGSKTPVARPPFSQAWEKGRG